MGTLTESRLIPSSNSYTPFSAEDLSELSVLYICALWIMYCDKDDHNFAVQYARRTIQFGSSFAKWHSGGTDLYNLIHGLKSDDVKLDDFDKSKKFKFSVPIGEALLLRWLREMSNGHVQTPTHRALFVKLDFNFKITNSALKSVRRLVMDWETINFGERSLAITRMLQLLRIRAQKSEILQTLTRLAKSRRLELDDADAPQATVRGGGFLAALAAGVRVANKLEEGRDAPLYHATSIYRAIQILKNGGFKADFAFDDNSSISTTRDPRLRYYCKDEEDIIGIAPIQFVLDQAKIAKRFKIKPFDYWDGGARWPSKEQNEINQGVRNHEAEERISSKSLPLSYVKEIWIMPLADDYLMNAAEDEREYLETEKNVLAAYQELIALANKNDIPVINKSQTNVYNESILKLSNNKSENGPADDFISDFNAETSDHPTKYQERVHGQVSVKIVKLNGNTIYLQDIYSYDQGKGNASNTMKLISSLANKTGVSIKLLAKPYVDDRLSLNQLQNWYERYGFETKREIDGGIEMERTPKTIIKLRGFRQHH